MDLNNPETLKFPGTELDPTADQENAESFCPEKDQRGGVSCTVTEDLTTNGSWSQRSISRSLQRAETLLRSTFNPSLKWLLHGRSQDEEEVEGNFVIAHNLVSRSSARLLRLQQALLTVAAHWQPISSTQSGASQVCGKGLPAEGTVLLLPSSTSLQGYYVALCRLLEQRSLLLFKHEYTRRARLTAAFVSRVSDLLEDQMKKPNLILNQVPLSLSSLRVGLCSLSQELRIHLNHWPCLFSRVQSDNYLRSALIQQTGLLVEIKHTLETLALQAMVLMEKYIFCILSALAQTELDSAPREVLEDILAGTDLYNQTVGEQRSQQSATQLRTTVLQQAHYSTMDSILPNSKGPHPAAFSVKELMTILAVHQANVTAKQLHCCTSVQSYHICQVHANHNAVSQGTSLSCGMSTQRSEWTWEQLQHTYPLSSPPLLINHHTNLQSSSCQSCHKNPPFFLPELHLESALFENNPLLPKPNFFQHKAEGFDKDQTSQCLTYMSKTGQTQSSVEALQSAQQNQDGQCSFKNCKLQTIPPPSATFHQLSAPLPLSGVCQQDHSSVEILFQVLVSSSDLLSSLGHHTPTTNSPTEQLQCNTLRGTLSPNGRTSMFVMAPVINEADTVECNSISSELNQDKNMEETQQKWADLEMTTTQETTFSSGFGKDGIPEKDTVGAKVTTVEPDCLRWPHSVQWLDLGQSLVFADLFGQYRTLLWPFCSKALWLQLLVPQAGNAAGSINLQDKRMRFQILHRISQTSQTDQFLKECRTMLEDFSLFLFVMTAHAQWDYVVCKSLGAALKDKCLTDVNQGSKSVSPSFKKDGNVMMTLTMEDFLLLPPPLLSSLCCYQSDSRDSGSFSLFPSRLSLQRQTVSLVVATVQLSTVWVLSKAYQFLSSWSLNKFLLITQGDLKVLRESLELMVHQTKAFMMNSNCNHHSVLHNHHQLLLRQQLKALYRAVSEVQTLSALVLKTYSSHCKRVSGEIFEQTMPSAVHWRPNLRTGFPGSPSEYASLATQAVIGQVLECVAPLSDDARVQALSITMTAFMEAWMEHILKQKIKFSVQGALQLKQDFDSIRELIQSEKYGLSAELHQQLLSLRIFQQVDSAVVCLLQQPEAKPYLQSRAWEPFTRCCPTNSSSDSIDGAVGSSITNLRCMEGEDLTQSDSSVVTTDLPPVNPSTTGEPYLAPSLALGGSQREWLDLRIHSSARRWRLPGLQCLSKTEP